MTKNPTFSAAAASDVPQPLIVADHRHTWDRRTSWRGGRRDSDWLNRPPGSLGIVAREHRRSLLRRLFGL